MPDDPQTVRFGVFEADLAAGELRRNGARVKLQEQPFQVLAALLEKPGDIVTKEELQRRIWNGDTFVDFDRSLATAVNKVRHALGDSARRPRFVETVPKKGYRFVGGGRETDALGSAHRIGRKAVALISLTSAALLGAAGFGWLGGDRAGRPVPTLEPLTTLPGFERFPAISPDGTRVAFAWQLDDDDQFDIYVKLIGAGEPRRLTETRSHELTPAWSADGRAIVFARYLDAGRIAIVQIPALGGQETELTRIADFGGPLLRPRQFCWAPGGDDLIVSDREHPKGPFEFYLHSLESGKRRRLTRLAADAIGDFEPSFDRSGAMAFVRANADGSRTILHWRLGDVADPSGEPEVAAQIPYLTYAPAISPVGDEIVFTAWAPLPELWRAPLSRKAPPERMLEAGERALHAAFSRDGSLLAHSNWHWEHDIWRVRLAEPGVAAGPPERLVASTYDEMWPDYSFDGRKIAFQSNRSGSHQIWISDAEGENAGRLTSMDSSFAGSPRWSPDASRIAFDSVENTWAVFVMDANGAGVRRVTDRRLSAIKPSWSRDGERLYFASFLERTAGIWRSSAEGGEPELLAAGFREIYHVDREELFLYGLNEARELWRVNLMTKEQEVVVEEAVSGFVLAEDGIYFTPAGPLTATEPIQFYRFADQTRRRVAVPSLSAARRFAISPDGDSLLFSQNQSVNSDLMLIRNYR